VEFFLARAQELNINLDSDIMEAALNYAVNHRNSPMIHWLVQHGAPVTGAIINSAAATNSLEFVEFLLDNTQEGVNMNLRDNKGETALNHATNLGNFPMMQLLIQHGASVKDNTGDHRHKKTPLMEVARTASLDQLIYLLRQGADPHQRNAYGETAIMYAAANENGLPVIKHLVEVEKVDPEASTVEGGGGKTPLMKVAMYCTSLHTVKYLVEDCGVDVNAFQLRGDTNALAEIRASGCKNKDIEDYLLSKGAIHREGNSLDLLYRHGPHRF
jgi:ankyrin repeat protein